MKSTSSSSGKKTRAIALPFLAIILTFTWLGFSGATAMAETNSTTPAGKFENCVSVREYSLTDPSAVTDKWWCKGVGLFKDTSDGELVAYDALPRTDTSSFAKHHQENRKQPTPPVVKVTRQQATEIALKKVPGVATSVVIERKRGENVYVVEIIAKEDGVETDVFVDIQSGKVVGTDK